MITLSVWGRTGPWAARRGFDSVLQCPTGITAAEGDDRAPGSLPAQVLDHATGYLAAAAALLALAGVERGEPPQLVQLSLAQTAQWLTNAGARERQPPHQLRPERFLVSLPSATGAVEVTRPPGSPGDLQPGIATTRIGADPPRFAMQSTG